MQAPVVGAPRLRARFDLPGGMIYLDGNSLGAMPKDAAARAHDVVTHEWGTDLIKSWNSAGWFDLPVRLGDKLAPLLGAEAGEVILCDSTSQNLYKVLSAAVAMRPERSVLILEGSNFPTNNYIAQGIAAHRSARLCLYGPPGTGKTAYGRWLAQALDIPLLVKRASDLQSMWVGECEKNIARVFREAEQDGALLLIDEVEAFCRTGAVPSKAGRSAR